MAEPDTIGARRAGLSTAQHDLAACLAAEAAAERAMSDAETEMWRRRDAASDLSDDDSAVEAFAQWLPQGRRQLAAAQATLDRAATETSRARAVLSHAEAACRAVEPAPGG